MTVAMNLWHLTLSPGEKYPVYVKRDFVITNVALGEELEDNSGRSVVKVTHQPINPDYFSDNDSEFDSDMSDDELPSDLDDDEEDEEEVAAPKGKAAKADQIEVDEDEDDEDDEDFDSDEEDEVPHVEAVMCALTAGKIEQASVNLTFVEGEIVVFEATGKNEVHLLGNYINQFPSEEDSDDEDDYSDMYESGDDEDEQSYDEEELEALMAADGRRGAAKGKITELPEETAPVASQKRKAEDVESPAKLTKAEKKKLKNAEGKAAAAPAPVEKKVEKKAEKPEAASAKGGVKKTLPSGLVIEDTKVGSGPVAKAGKRLGMRYIGKLENGKQFDANTGGKPFQFVLGKGEVISGWDQGIAGMAVGGERRLTIPAALAYGNQKIPGIPKNSTLKFDIKLVEIK